ncbi:hypothetical protein IE81DRAFT_332408 [Ceraceosorus guamensis]|uniref:Uncharacterized protein n=1 Tax=Ceraceosorus guamensis TaxID=1522189 RepID=A0A316VPR8_9BASI|nr:hypothetical protein IE81DRAFT_332408 [Ceraceosorus guamensis]PWN39330.1 hypothetical protein IE81DRAFT_332408 [Ceraceosorus guamensis]
MNCTAPVNNNLEKKLQRLLIQLGITDHLMIHHMETREEYAKRIERLSAGRRSKTKQNQHFQLLVEAVSDGKQGLKLEHRAKHVISGAQLGPMGNHAPMLFSANWVLGVSKDPWASEPAGSHGHNAIQRLQPCMFEDVAKIQRASKQGRDLARKVVTKGTAHYVSASGEAVFYLGYWCDRRDETDATMHWWGSKDLTQFSCAGNQHLATHTVLSFLHWASMFTDKWVQRFILSKRYLVCDVTRGLWKNSERVHKVVTRLCDKARFFLSPMYNMIVLVHGDTATKATAQRAGLACSLGTMKTDGRYWLFNLGCAFLLYFPEYDIWAEVLWCDTLFIAGHLEWRTYAHPDAAEKAGERVFMLGLQHPRHEEEAAATEEFEKRHRGISSALLEEAKLACDVKEYEGGSRSKHDVARAAYGPWPTLKEEILRAGRFLTEEEAAAELAADKSPAAQDQPTDPNAMDTTGIGSSSARAAADNFETSNVRGSSPCALAGPSTPAKRKSSPVRQSLGALSLDASDDDKDEAEIVARLVAERRRARAAQPEGASPLDAADIPSSASVGGRKRTRSQTQGAAQPPSPSARKSKGDASSLQAGKAKGKATGGGGDAGKKTKEAAKKKKKRKL